MMFVLHIFHQRAGRSQEIKYQISKQESIICLFLKKSNADDEIGVEIFHRPRPISNAQNSLLEDVEVETLESLGGLISQIKFPSQLASFSK